MYLLFFLKLHLSLNPYIFYITHLPLNFLKITKLAYWSPPSQLIPPNSWQMCKTPNQRLDG